MADEKKEEATKQQPKEVTSTCTVSINDLFLQLHKKALEQVKNAKIENSAIDDKGFHGAGSHVIAALPIKGEVIKKTDAVKALNTYITYFNGPDAAQNVTEDVVWPIENNEENKNTNSTPKESFIFVPSFNNWLLTEETDKESSLSAAAQLSADVEKDEAESDSAKGFYITYKIEIEGQKEKPLSDALKSFGAGLLRGLGVQGFSWKTGAKGKEHTVGDLVDSLSEIFGKIDPNELKARFAKNIQAKYPETTAKDISYYDKNTILQHLKNKLSTADKTKIKGTDYSLCYRVPANDKSKKLINTTVVADCITRSIKGLFKKFKNQVKKDDVILVNDYNETNKDEKKADNKLEIKTDKEKITTDSRKFHYKGRQLNEEASDKDADTSKKEETPAKDEQQEKNLDDMTKKLNELAEKTLGKDNFEYSFICKKDESGKIVALKQDDKTKDFSIEQTDLPDLFTDIDGEKVNYAFVIETKHVEKSDDKENTQTKKEESLQTSIDAMVKKLFEASDKKDKKDDKKTILDEIEHKVTNAFKVLFDSFKQLLGKDQKMQEPKLYQLKKSTQEAVNSSLQPNYSFVNRLFESAEFNDDIAELLVEGKNHKALDDKKWNAFKKLVSANLDEIRKNKKAIIKQSYEDQGQMLSFTKDDEARNNGYDDFIYALFDDNTNKEDALEKLRKITHRNNFRNDIVYRFKFTPSEEPKEEPPKEEEEEHPKPEPVPEEVKKINVGFMDKDPATDNADDPIYKSVEPGGTVTPIKPKYATDKHEFVGWRDSNGNLDSFDDIQAPTTYMAEYKGIEPDKFPVTFFDIDFENGTTPEIDTQQIEKGKSATAPTEPNHEDQGYKFKGWSDTFDNIDGPKQIIAEYDQIIKIIPKAPKDPAKPTEDLEPIGDPIEYDPEKPIEEQLPTPPEKEGWKANGWNPEPSEIKDPKEDVEITATYEKVEDEKPTEEKSAEVHTYWICPDTNGFLTSKTVSVNADHTDVDFYIVPMKGLKLNKDNTDNDDKKAVEGKGKQ